MIKAKITIKQLRKIAIKRKLFQIRTLLKLKRIFKRRKLRIILRRPGSLKNNENKNARVKIKKGLRPIIFLLKLVRKINLKKNRKLKRKLLFTQVIGWARSRSVNFFNRVLIKNSVKQYIASRRLTLPARKIRKLIKKRQKIKREKAIKRIKQRKLFLLKTRRLKKKEPIIKWQLSKKFFADLRKQELRKKFAKLKAREKSFFYNKALGKNNKKSRIKYKGFFKKAQVRKKPWLKHKAFYQPWNFMFNERRRFRRYNNRPMFNPRTVKFRKLFAMRSLVQYARADKPLRQRFPFIAAGSYLVKLAKMFKTDLSYFLKQKIALKFTFVYNNTITTQILLRYILDKLEKLYLPREFIPYLLQKFEGRRPHFDKKNEYVPRRLGLFGKQTSGLMIKCAGRFTRAQMASHLTFYKGNMPLSTIKKNIKYSWGETYLKYGSLGIKVYLLKTNNI